jgi:glycosyltransferase involved in cell wall biosynthesis
MEKHLIRIPKMALDKSQVLVLVPAFNEVGSIARTIEELVKLELDVLVIDDGSTDDSAQVARSAGALVLQLPFNLGVGGALRAGFQHASWHGYKAVIQVDADGQHPADQIVDLISEANSFDCHMVVGSRFLSDSTTMRVGKIRRIPMRLLASSASRATGVSITDATSGFRLIQQPLLGEFAQSFPAYYLGDTYEALISAGKAGYIIREIPAALHAREVGESSASAPQAIKFIAKCLLVAALRIHFSIKPFSVVK